MHNKVGYIKLYRSLTDNEIYMLPPLYLRVFERLILEANHQDNEIPYRKNGEIKTKLIKRGEKLTSIRQISEWVGWYERGVFKSPNPKLIKEILDYLIESKMIFIYGEEGNRTETHYKIVNYELYQDKEDIKVTEQKQEKNNIETEKKQLAPQNKNDKNDKNENKIKYAEYVAMKEEEYIKLIQEYGEIIIKNKIIDLNLWKGSKGKSTKSDYMTILAWIRKDNINTKQEIKSRPNSAAYEAI